MNFFAGKRKPLKEDQFTDTGAAQFYDDHARRFMRLVFRRFAAKAAEIKVTGRQVLDIGTGSGLAAIELAKARPGWWITGVDVSENMLEMARQNAAQNNLADRIDFRQTPAEALPFADGFFDLVVSNASLHLWTDPFRVFDEIARVTAPGGHCLIWDNLRVGAGPLLGLAGGMMGMNQAQGRLWTRAVQSSYTGGEVKAMLKKSALKSARVTVYPLLLELGIDWEKGPE